MKPTIPFVLLLVITVPNLFGLDQVFLEPVVPVSPSLKAQGGVSTANARGYDALFSNPAAFADESISLTFMSVETTAHVPLAGINQVLDARDSWGNTNLLAANNPLRDVINNLLTDSGVGQEASIGMGWVGRNLGLGFVTQARMLAKGPSLLDTKTTFDQTTMGVIGMAWPFQVGPGTLQLGGAIRPMQRAFTQVTISDILANTTKLNAYTLSSGFGLGLDLGVKWNYSGLQAGLAVRDASSTVFNFQQFGASEWAKGLTFPSGGSSEGTSLYRIPTVVGVGGSWTPELGTLGAIFQPSLSADLQIPIKDEFSQPSFWTWTHLGAEAKLLGFFALRAGVNQGYFTFGMGARMFLVDFNMALYADELGRYAGLNRRSGVSMEWAVRL